MRFTRPAMVAHLAAAYRRQHKSAYADLVIANRHRDALPAEILEALSVVLVEAESERIVSRASRSLDPDDLDE